jgi:deoxyribodipyrimidine photo-lyase
VFAHIDHALGENPVIQGGHRYQKVVGEIDRSRIAGHSPILPSTMAYLFDTGLVWLRRDLRVHDNAALATALQQCRRVHCLFVLDRAILDPLPRQDRRVAFILESLTELDAALRKHIDEADTGLLVAHGNATEFVAACAISAMANG